MKKFEPLLIVDPLSLNNDVYFTENGDTTKDKNKALIVYSIEEGDKKAKHFTLYKPVYKTF